MPLLGKEDIKLLVRGLPGYSSLKNLPCWREELSLDRYNLHTFCVMHPCLSKLSQTRQILKDLDFLMMHYNDHDLWHGMI